MNYAEAVQYLESHVDLAGSRGDRFAVTLPDAGHTDGLSLDPVKALLEALGNPHEAYRTIHITGTNGKGSTARFVSALLKATDLSVATYTSPNIESINERLMWDGELISDEDFAEVMTLLAAVEPLVGHTPNRFELLTAAAFVWFAQMGVDVAVVEVGMLGRFDATNVVSGDVAVVTNIGKDHTSGGEGWQVAVATEKAGIIKPNSHVVLGFSPEELAPVFAAEPSVATWTLGEDFVVESNQLAVGGRVVDVKTPNGFYEQVFIPFHGAHQGDNLAVALAATEAFFGRAIDMELVDQALSDVTLMGRFEVVARHPLIILDGAHNPDGARAASATLTEEFARLGSWVLVIGLVGNKDPVEMLEAFDATDFDAVICCEPDWNRRVPAQRIAAAAASLGIPAEVVTDPVEAVQRALAVTAEEDLILVSGTIYVLGDVRRALALAFQE